MKPSQIKQEIERLKLIVENRYGEIVCPCGEVFSEITYYKEHSLIHIKQKEERLTQAQEDKLAFEKMIEKFYEDTKLSIMNKSDWVEELKQQLNKEFE